jgi:hypothetical protein
MFQAKTSRGEDASEGGAGGSIKTTHRNAITCVRAVPSGGGVVAAFSTSAVDGQLCVWAVAPLNVDMAGMRI